MGAKRPLRLVYLNICIDLYLNNISLYLAIYLSRQLSYEKCELEQSMEQKSRVAERMSQNVEELQWRIRY